MVLRYIFWCPSLKINHILWTFAVHCVDGNLVRLSQIRENQPVECQQVEWSLSPRMMPFVLWIRNHLKDGLFGGSRLVFWSYPESNLFDKLNFDNGRLWSFYLLWLAKHRFKRNNNVQIWQTLSRDNVFELNGKWKLCLYSTKYIDC